MSDYYSDAEVLEMADPLTQPAAIRRWLKRSGFHFEMKPSGMPLISRDHVKSVLSGDTLQEPKNSGNRINIEALKKALKLPDGPQTQK